MTEVEANKKASQRRDAGDPVGVVARGTHRERQTRTWEAQFVPARVESDNRKKNDSMTHWESDHSMVLGKFEC